MTIEIFVRYLHFVSLFMMMGTLITELLMVKSQMTGAEMRRVAVIDGLYGLHALLAVGAGLTLWLWIGKPAAFYTSNPVFHIKLTIVIVVALLSLIPTVYFLKTRRSLAVEEVIDVPVRIRRLIRVQVFLLMLVPLLAVMMAKGVGMSPVS